MNIWQDCNGKNNIIPLDEYGYRVVETQQYGGLRKTVDSDAEQDVLQELIESVKPTIPQEYEELHYLLYTPFRYPSSYPSRFRTGTDKGIFYGALDNMQIAFAESAYHYFLRLSESEAPIKQHTTFMASFKFEVKTNFGIDLTQSPFSEYKDNICHLRDYTSAQGLCHFMRDDNIEAFIYDSVRHEGKNIAILSPKAFAKKKPDDIIEWHCFTDADNIEFYQISTKDKYLFPKNNFFK